MEQPVLAYSDDHWMSEALVLAHQAAECGEVPVGAILVRDNQVLGRGYNQPISRSDPTAHAEIIALREAAAATGNYRLPGTTLYVTLEPCAMCAGALSHARVQRLVFGASDLKQGMSNHRVECSGGVLAFACAEVLTAFFRTRRD